MENITNKRCLIELKIFYKYKIGILFQFESHLSITNIN